MSSENYKRGKNIMNKTLIKKLSFSEKFYKTFVPLIQK